MTLVRAFAVALTITALMAAWMVGLWLASWRGVGGGLVYLGITMIAICTAALYRSGRRDRG